MNTRTLTHPTLTIDAADLPHDHVGDDTAPMTESGTRYSYALLDDDRQEITWATDADGILAHLIDGYPLDEPDDPAARRQVLHDRVVARARYTYATLVNHAAQAIMAGAPIEICNVLEAAADFAHPDQLPTIADYPAWTHDIPLGLAAQFYAPYDPTRTAPLGRVVLLDTDTPELLLESLARLGAIRLMHHTSLDAPGHVSVATVDRRTMVEQDLEAAAGALFVLEDDPESLDATTAAGHVDDLRMSLQRLATSARALGIAEADLAGMTRSEEAPAAELITIAGAIIDGLSERLSGAESSDAS